MEKLGPDGPKWGQEDFCPTNPDLADILGRTYFNFDNFLNGLFVLGGIPLAAGAIAAPITAAIKRKNARSASEKARVN